MTATPAWVQKRDGRLVPFDADKISRSLFAATEHLGHPDAFLARELTDSVVHFLSAEAEGAIPTTAQIAELVVKVVRELGHPALSRAYVERPRGQNRVGSEEGPPAEVVLRFSPQQAPAAVVEESLRAYTLHAVYARDLVAAHNDGLIALTQLHAPLELTAAVLEPPAPRPGALLEALLDARRHTAGVVVLDGVEHLLTRSRLDPDAAAAGFLHELTAGLSATGLRAVVNLNGEAPPPWAGDVAEGPLFAVARPGPERLTSLADALLDVLCRSPLARGQVRIDWHLGERDFAGAAAARLLRLARFAADEAALGIVFDRPRRAVALAEGIDRRHPCLLTAVGLQLPRLAEQPGLNADAELFVQKLGSLARMALSAAVQKREFLRRRRAAGLARGFLLERARLMVVPVGLEAAVRQLTGRGLCDGKGLELARRALQRLREVLRQDGRACLVEACIDGPADFVLEGGDRSDSQRIAGLTAWDIEAPVKGQLRAAGGLHAVAEGGTAAVLLPEGPLAAEQLADWLRWAWRQSDAVRVRFVRPAPVHRQLSLIEPAG